MAIQSMDQLITSLSAGQKWRADFNKNALPTTAQVVGQWYDLFTGAGNPPAATVLGAGTNLLWNSLYDYSPTTSSSIQHGGDVAPYVKQALNASIFSAAATTAPAVFMLVDMLAFIPITTVTALTLQTLLVSDAAAASNGSPALVMTTTANDFPSIINAVQFTTTTTLPTGLALNTTYWVTRTGVKTYKVSTTYTNAKAGTYIAYTDAGTGTHTMTMRPPRYANGAGVQAYLVPSTVMGASATTTATLTYTNATTNGNAGTAARTTPTAPALPLGNTAAPVGSIAYAGTGAGKYGPFMPLAAGDQGIQTPTGFTLGTASYVSGVLNLVLCRPLLTLPVTTVGVAAERDLLNQLPSAPIIYDGACLNWLQYAGAATPVNSAYFGNIDFAWG